MAVTLETDKSHNDVTSLRVDCLCLERSLTFPTLPTPLDDRFCHRSPEVFDSFGIQLDNKSQSGKKVGAGMQHGLWAAFLLL